MIYILSDIHGNTRRFKSIMEQINLQQDDTLYILGDVIDRYSGGIELLQRLMKMPNVKMLLGNHEEMMLRALGSPFDTNETVDDQTTEKYLRHWYRNGGGVTHESWKLLQKEQQNEILDYLHSLPLEFDLTVNGQNYKLVHAAPIELYDRYKEDYADALHFSLYKRLKISDDLPGGYILIFGHTPTIDFDDCCPMKIFHGSDRIAIDCGSGFPEEFSFDNSHLYGRLACLRLEDMKEFYSEENLDS